MADSGDHPDWLNLPDLAFNEIMMMISLRNCMQVCSSWKERITKNILENPTKKNIIRARMERARKMRQQVQQLKQQVQQLTDCVFKAHQRFCLLSREQIQLGCSQGINEEEVEKFKDMVSAFIICPTLVHLFSCRPPRICGSMQPAE